MSKIIEHDSQTFMFDGAYTQKLDDKDSFKPDELKIKDVSFANSHLVAEYFYNKDEKVAEALYFELEAKFRLK